MKEFRFVHASGDTFMSLAKTKSDVGNLMQLDPEPLWITVTEAGESVTMKSIRAEIKKIHAPYHLVNPDRGDIAFLVHDTAHIRADGGRLAVPADHRAPSDGGHGPRLNSWVEIQWEHETIFANGVHLVTYNPDHKPGGVTRGPQQVHQVELLGAQMKRQAEGGALAIGSGDLNGALPNRHDLQRVFDHYGMTTTSQETKVRTGTHGNARIDYAWTMDRDRRLHVVNMKVLKSNVYESDHDPIVNDCEIR